MGLILSNQPRNRMVVLPHYPSANAHPALLLLPTEQLYSHAGLSFSAPTGAPYYFQR